MADDERLRRWRLMLGSDADASCCALGAEDQGLDQVLQALYNPPEGRSRRGGLGGSAPKIHRWLGDIRSYFPRSVVQVMQRDAFERLGLKQMLTEPELLSSLEADVHLVAQLISLGSVIPNKTKETARMVVRKVVDELERKLANPLKQAVRGALNKGSRTNRPRAHEIDWPRTIRKNLHNYWAEKKTIIAERLVGHRRRSSSLRDVVLCVDQSGSMATSVVYSSIFAAVLASLRAVSTKLVCFDTSIIDLSEKLQDPVEVLFGTQLGGGTDINRAIAYCETLITRPGQTIFVLVSDLCEGGNAQEMVRRVGALAASGVQIVCLLALSDEGAPIFDEQNAAAFAALGIPAFACTPDLFPDLMAHAVQKRDLALWAARHEITAAAPTR